MAAAGSAELIISEFVCSTGADFKVAKDFLQDKNWDLVAALKAYSSTAEEGRNNCVNCDLMNSRNFSKENSNQPDNNAKSFLHHQNQIQDGENGTQEQRTTIIIDPAQPTCTSAGQTRSAVISGGGAQTPVQSSDPVDEEENNNKRLVRGFSKATENAHLLSSARHYMTRGLSQVANQHVNTSYCHIETPSYTFTLPDLAQFAPDFRRFLEKDLVETSTLKALETSGHLNWWTNAAQKLWPLATSGDGNCLLHSASLGMWGFHDRLLILRKALYLILAKGSRRHALWRRWRWQQTYMNKESGLVYSEEEWRNEWNSLVRLASSQPRSKPGSAEPIDPDKNPALEKAVSSGLPNQVEDDESDLVYESLEEIHVFALAHVLKRPVIVVADTVLRDSGGEAFAPIPFGGIYLPLECPPNECHRSPLVLAYDAAHFSALVLMQTNGKTMAAEPKLPAIVPLTYKERRLLPLHFACDPGPDFTWWTDDADRRIASKAILTDEQKIELICRYLDILKIPLRRGSIRPEFVRLKREEANGWLERSSRSLPSAYSTEKKTAGLSGSTGKLPASKEEAKRGRQRKFSLNRLASSLRLRLKTSQKEWKENNKKSTPVDSQKPPSPVIPAELKDPNLVVGAQLYTQAHHQYMEEMVENYLKAARGRFDTEQKALAAGIGSAGGRPPAPNARLPRRERISRSFSTSSMVVTCMNGECERPASHATNFLCEQCFRTQKELMASFSTGGPSAAAGNWRQNDVQVSPILSPSRRPMLAEENWMRSANSSSSLTVRERQGSGREERRTVEENLEKRNPDSLEMEETVERRYGVNAVTTPQGVTHYYVPEIQYCRSPLCSNYSNGHPDLCVSCMKNKHG